MIVSDAKTGEAFRAEVVKELGRRASNIQAACNRASTKKERERHEGRLYEINDAKAFFESIVFGDFPVLRGESGQKAFERPAPGA